MAQRATSLGPKPSLLVICFCLFVFCLLFLGGGGFGFVFGGFKGQVRWPKSFVSLLCFFGFFDENNNI